jgi:hypothetical protein
MLVRYPLYRPTRSRRQRVRRHVRHGVCTAALRSVTAAKLYIAGTTPNLLKAAESCGSNVTYVRAAVVVLRAENSVLLDRVLRGHIPLLAAASQVEKLVGLIAAYNAASEQDHVAFARAAGPDRLFDEAVQAVS